MTPNEASIIPPGARVLVEGIGVAIVRDCFLDGSSSYLFPHFKLDFVGGDRNVAVNIRRVFEVRSK